MTVIREIGGLGVGSGAQWSTVEHSGAEQSRIRIIKIKIKIKEKCDIIAVWYAVIYLSTVEPKGTMHDGDWENRRSGCWEWSRVEWNRMEQNNSNKNKGKMQYHCTILPFQALRLIWPILQEAMSIKESVSIGDCESCKDNV